MKYAILSTILAGCLCLSANAQKLETHASPHDLVFEDIAKTWDEGMPLGNAIIGALIWQNENSLRFSLDRIDLWDLRPTDFVKDKTFKFKWVEKHVHDNNYGVVQQTLDAPYNSLPGPSKIPGAAMEFDISALGPVKSNRLYLKNAVCEIEWQNGARLQSYVHASQPVGYFCFEGVDENFTPRLVPPTYNSKAEGKQDNSHAGADLDRLGYAQGTVTQKGNSVTYKQPGWGDFSYEVSIQWKREGKKLTGVWSITSSLIKEKAPALVSKAINDATSLYGSHQKWWNEFWSKSSIQLPDPVLEKQYYNEIYKFGSTARENSYPISLQAVWTADNGKLPPWKGDFHHDLNTQLSYWPCYTGNYITEGLGYLNTLWDQKKVNKRYTQSFFETDGLNVPGVCTLLGEPMGGWVQYSCSPTVSAWLAQHFYLHWKYSQDRTFLKEKGYPYLKEVATFLEDFSIIENGKRKLPLSSSPEIHDNSIKAWFKDTTNYDLALMKFAFLAAADLAKEMDKTSEAQRWEKAASQLPDFDVDPELGLTFAPGDPYRSSHRHFSHAMAIHPLGLVDISHGEKDRSIITKTIASLDKFGPGAWTGYSYSWLGNMKARAGDGEGAATALRDFAQCFCLRNTFHVNGDQTKSGKSGFTYRPFTLEGNFAFASGVQDMLIQSHTGIIRLFPAIPASWNDVSFNTLRTYGAFLVSAERKDGKTNKVVIRSDKGGICRIESPFGDAPYTVKADSLKVTDSPNGTLFEITMKPGEEVVITRD